MTTASGSLGRVGLPQAATVQVARSSWLRRLFGLVIVLLALGLVWEGAKWMGGDPWRIHGSGSVGLPIAYEAFSRRSIGGSRTTCRCPTSGTWSEPLSTRPSAGGPPLGLVLAGQAAFTFGEALVGFVVGGLLGLGLGVLFVHSRLAERALVPVRRRVADRADPGDRPDRRGGHQGGLGSVTAVSAYLTFFPVTIASLRGLRAADPRAFELFRSYAATRRQILWSLRLPTSVPYLFVASSGCGGIDHRGDHR